MLHRFVRGEDKSVADVNSIEGFLITHFQDTELFEELTAPLASYRPGGGPHLYDEAALTAEIEHVLRRFFSNG
jgi:hypothetical protein